MDRDVASPNPAYLGGLALASCAIPVLLLFLARGEGSHGLLAALAIALFGLAKAAERHLAEQVRSWLFAPAYMLALLLFAYVVLMALPTVSAVLVAASFFAVVVITRFELLALVWEQAAILDLRIARLFGWIEEPATAAGPTAPSRQEVAPQPAERVPAKAPRSAVEALGIDLTEQARKGELETVIGRDEEIERVIQILARTRKANPLLIGEPGVGKTAIAHGLAWRIADGRVPELFADHRLVEINMATSLAGAANQGQFEARLKALLEEVRDSGGRLLLFIDEAHQLVRAGAAAGGMSAAEILKPALARDLRVIGATTTAESEELLADESLARRFEPVQVPEPSAAEAVEMLRSYQRSAAVPIEDDALYAAAALSERYQPDRLLPDKALTLLDDLVAAARVSKSSGVSEADVVAAVAGQSGVPAERLAADLEQGPSQARRAGRTRYLEAYGSDLSAAAARGELHPAIGRDDEIDQVLRVLGRRQKNNAVLLGEPGVGKTAIAKGLALRISEGNVPPAFAKRRVIELDLNAMVGGTNYRGEFEQRLQGILDELRAEGAGGAIIFVDEIHNLVRAGSAESTSGAGEALKPILARGELKLIGASTPADYRAIEGDPALARRFEPVMVNEPSIEEAIEILKGLRPLDEAHHQLQIADGAIEAAVVLAAEFARERRLPDSAITLLDDAASAKSLEATGGDPLDAEDLISTAASKLGQSREVLRRAHSRERVVEIEVVPPGPRL